MAQTERVTFIGALGEELAARLDLPAGKPRAYALFAHCFTCSKDIYAAARVSAGLAERGIAVLRFDFTGLGHSDGEFANTNFSSNVADLVAAADFLRTEHEAPKILIGHSLGGAAVLAAAEQIDEVVGVATIGAPYDVAHVSENFAASVADIEANGEAEVSLGGRPFVIKKQFLDDICSQAQHERIAALGRALLVFHSPRDETVGIENAAEIYGAAMHPKSFITLDDADHLLTRKADAIYVADIISSWASRYLDETLENTTSVPRAKDGEVVVEETGENRFSQIISAGGRHTMLADEPPSVGGGDTGPTPYDLLVSGLGACTSMTIRMYANRKKLPLDKVSVVLRHNKIHAEDCEECETQDGKIDQIEREITLSGDLDEEQRAKLLEIADKCPVHRTLHSEVSITSKLV